MIAPDTLTKTERRLFDILADGEWHTKGSLLEPVTGKRFASGHLIPVHINRLKGKLGSGIVIHCETGRGYCMRATPAGGGHV